MTLPVSIVIPAYNQAHFLPQTLDSVLHQTYPHFEVIIVDDGSTDETSKICNAFSQQDSRIHIIQQPNQGPSAARNHGIREAKGKYICFLDADDLMDPKRVELQLAEFEKNSAVDVVYTAVHLINDQGESLGTLRGIDHETEDFLAYMLFRNLIPGPSIMAKREPLIRYPFNEHLKHAEDYELMLRLAHHCKFKYLDLPLTFYRRHQKNLSNSLKEHRQAEFNILKSYSQEHIEKVVDKSHLSKEDKTLLKGKIYFNREDWDIALETFKPLLKPLSLFYQGNCYFKLNQIEMAIKVYTKSIELDPKTNPAVYNNLGIVYFLNNDINQSINSFKNALKLSENYQDAKKNLLALSHQEKPIYFTLKELRSQLMPYQK